jgi:hypothetical protein
MYVKIFILAHSDCCPKITLAVGGGKDGTGHSGNTEAEAASVTAAVVSATSSVNDITECVLALPSSDKNLIGVPQLQQSSTTVAEKSNTSVSEGDLIQNKD